jgi:hypothetical protein
MPEIKVDEEECLPTTTHHPNTQDASSKQASHQYQDELILEIGPVYILVAPIHKVHVSIKALHLPLFLYKLRLTMIREFATLRLRWVFATSVL